MGLAGYTHPSNFTRHRHITTLALIRLRERSGERFASRDDQDLGNLLDEAIEHGVRDGRSDEIIDDGQVRHVVELSATPIGELYALCRPDARERRDVVMTILTTEQVTCCRSSGRWQRRDTSGATVPIGLARIRDLVPETQIVIAPPLELLTTPPPTATAPPETTHDMGDLMPRKKQDDEWVTRDVAATMLGYKDRNYISKLSTRNNWPRRMVGKTVLYARNAIEAFHAQPNGHARHALATVRKPAKSARKAIAARVAVELAAPEPAAVDAPPRVASDAPMYLVRLSYPLGIQHFDCTESELEAKYQTLIASGIPATDIAVYRLVQTRLRLELA